MLRKKDPLLTVVEKYLTPNDDVEEVEAVHHIDMTTQRVWDGWFDQVTVSTVDEACCRVCEARVPVQDAQFTYINLFGMCGGTFLCHSCCHAYMQGDA